MYLLIIKLFAIAFLIGCSGTSSKSVNEPSEETDPESEDDFDQAEESAVITGSNAGVIQLECSFTHEDEQNSQFEVACNIVRDGSVVMLSDFSDETEWSHRSSEEIDVSIEVDLPDYQAVYTFGATIPVTREMIEAINFEFKYKDMATEIDVTLRLPGDKVIDDEDAT